MIGGGPTAVNPGSSNMIVWPPAVNVFFTVVTTHEAQGGSVGALLGMAIVVGRVIFHDTVVFPSGPTLDPASVAPGNSGGGDHGEGPAGTWGMIVVPSFTVGVAPPLALHPRASHLSTQLLLNGTCAGSLHATRPRLASAARLSKSLDPGSMVARGERRAQVGRETPFYAEQAQGKSGQTLRACH